MSGMEDLAGIGQLVAAYTTAVDKQNWADFEALFTPDAELDYTSAGGIAGKPSEVAAWLSEAMKIFTWGMHSISTHDVVLDGDSAAGTLHVIARGGVEFDGKREILTVGGFYEDRYVRVEVTPAGEPNVWRIAARTEHTQFFDGGEFASMAENAAAARS